MSAVLQELAHVGPHVPPPGHDCSQDRCGTDHWKYFFNLEPCLVSEPSSESRVVSMQNTSLVHIFYLSVRLGKCQPNVKMLILRGSDFWPPNSHQANMDKRNNPEHLQSTLIWRGHYFWTAELNITENSISISACFSTCAGQSVGARLGHFTASSIWINIFQCAQVSRSLNRWVLQNFNCIKCKKERDTLSNQRIAKHIKNKGMN